MLLHYVVEPAQFFAAAVLEAWCFNDFLHMRLVDEPRSIKSCNEALDSFFIMLTRARQPFNCMFGCAILERMLQIHQLFRIRQVGTVMY